MPGGPIAVTFLKNDSLWFVDMSNGPPVTIVNGYLPGGGRASCGPGYGQYCVSYGGTINYTFHRDEAQLTLSVDSETVSTGSVVTFTAGVTPATVSGITTPISFDTTTWIPDADSLGGDYTEAATLSPGAWVARKYQRTIIGGGTLRLVAHVNGIRYVGTQHVGSRDRLTLTAVHSYISTGDSVTFAPHMSDGSAFSVYFWQWTADSTASPLTHACSGSPNPCRTPVFENGYMTVNVRKAGLIRHARAHATIGPPPPLLLIASPPSIDYGDSATFVVSAHEAPVQVNRWEFRAGSSITPVCTADSHCRWNAPVSGTMWVWASVDTKPDSASAAVSVRRTVAVTVDSEALFAGSTAHFTAILNDSAASPTQWLWVPDSGATSTPCGAAVTCAHEIHQGGAMWAVFDFGAFGRDSSLARVSLRPRRRLGLVPTDTTWAVEGDEIEFQATGEDGAPVGNTMWTPGNDGAGFNRLRSGLNLSLSGGGVISSSTCTAGVITCTDIVVQSYTKILTAVVDDSVQTVSSPVEVFEPLSTSEDSHCPNELSPYCTLRLASAAERAQLHEIASHWTANATCLEARDSAFAFLDAPQVPGLTRVYLHNDALTDITNKIWPLGDWTAPPTDANHLPLDPNGFSVIHLWERLFEQPPNGAHYFKSSAGIWYVRIDTPLNVKVSIRWWPLRLAHIWLHENLHAMQVSEVTDPATQEFEFPRAIYESCIGPGAFDEPPPK